jgi:hypothetical protein
MQQPYGLYDFGHQVVVIPSDQIAPFIVVEHEMTHVALTMLSSFGLLSEVIRFLIWLAELSSDGSALSRGQELHTVMIKAGEMVHEAVAWFGTEIQTELETAGTESFKEPARYSADIDQLRTLLRKLPRDPELIVAVESVATFALDIPFFGSLWDDPKALSPAELEEVFVQPHNNPLIRFRKLCGYFQTVPTSAFLEWSKAISYSAEWLTPEDERLARYLPNGLHSAGSDMDPVPVVFRCDLSTENTLKVIRALGQSVGLDLREGDISSEGLSDWWKAFKLLGLYSRKVDRYAQVVICEYDGLGPEFGLLQRGDQPPRTLRFCRHMIVQRMAADSSQPHEICISGGPEINAIPIEEVDAFDELLHSDSGSLLEFYHDRVGWHGPIKEMHAFLAEYSKTKPIIVSSNIYDTANFAVHTAAPLLNDIPHVVFAPIDFKSLWIRFTGIGAVHGPTTIEWAVMPPDRLSQDYGYFVFKISNRPFPVFVMPCLPNYYKRTLSVANTIESKFGVKLSENERYVDEWLGEMLGPVYFARYAFETTVISNYSGQRVTWPTRWRT